MISHAADADEAIVHEAWHLVPVPSTDGGSRSVLATAWPDDVDPSSAQACTELLATGLAVMQGDATHHRRAAGLSAVLDAASQWQMLDDTDDLLQAIAEATTETIGCERATIFLWDRRVGKLIGRPAMGIEGDELIVSDSAGVVGEVLHSAEPKLWSLGADSAGRLNQSVDEKTGFQTQSLAAVAMRDPSEKLIGVFEAINHHSGSFDSESTLRFSNRFRVMQPPRFILKADVNDSNVLATV